MTDIDRRTTCPHCGHRGDRLGTLEDDAAENPPAIGSAILCIRCGLWSILDADGTTHKATLIELAELLADPDAHRLRTAWQRMDNERRRRGHR